jgi:serine/threonine-protein kinase
MPAASKIICPGCRAAYDADTNYCARCGASLRATPAEDRSRRTEPAFAVPDHEEFAHDDSGPRDPLIGRVIDGRYRVLERLGAGGMGIVYKVEHQRMGKIAAMKVLHRSLAADREVLRRFRREAEAVSKLTHPNTVQTFDFGALDGGGLYLVMEHVRGEDLATLIRVHGPQPFARVAPIFMQVCEALAEAHELGIVHRDLKPENILVTHGKDGRDHAKVLDFGLATLAERPSDLSAPDLIVGTPLYMAPEQIRVERLDGRADIYALGAVLYRVLTGEPPFQAQTPVGVLTKHLHDAVVPPSERRRDLPIPPQADAIVLRAMAKRPEERFPSVDALRGAIGAALAELSHPAARPHPTPPPHRLASAVTTPQERLGREDFDAFERSIRRQALVRTIVIPVLLAGVGLAAAAWWSFERERPKTVEVEPNDELATATPIAPGSPVRGTIGRRIAADAGDRDHFRVATGAAPGKARRVAVELGAIPNIDLTVALFDGSGRFLIAAKQHGVGRGEALDARVEDDPVYVLVLEEAGSAPVPTENLSDEYLLAVTLE